MRTNIALWVTERIGIKDLKLLILKHIYRKSPHLPEIINKRVFF